MPPRRSSTSCAAGRSRASSTRTAHGPHQQEEDEVDTNRPLSRRRLLKVAGGATVAAGLAPYLQGAQAFGRPATASAGSIKMWWWGQQEAVGIQKWMTDTIKMFKAKEGINNAPTLMDTSQVIPSFPAAAAPGNVPDVQFLFNGIYHMENVWLGSLQLLDTLLS